MAHLAYKHVSDSFFIQCYTKIQTISSMDGVTFTNIMRTKL